MTTETPEATPTLTFTSTTHDPDNRLGYLIEETGDRLRNLFASASVAYTPKTHPATVSQLRERAYSTFRAEDSVISCYQTALSRATTPNTDSLFYCDLDRALHWIKSHPQELEALATTNYENDFVLIGRTRRAFETHPETQTMTESIGNTVASRVLGFTEPRDILGTTWILTPALAGKILNLKPNNRYGFYTDWPIQLWNNSTNPAYIEVEGLEWETPDRYQQEIAQAGYGVWKENYQNVQEWRKRNLMLRDMIEATMTRIHFQKST